ncbi:MAG: prepilin peptidase [Planctomycetota bacterium]|jgi:prepilin signal peptidase PulO-like enzyme (type II secretory pathway)
MTQAIVWWLFFFTALGLCIGSFLNVVVYRIPLNQSLRSPLWSACPYCRERIRLYDNIPIVSFLLLRGRCRSCHAPIATRYLVVEAAMAVIVLMLLDAFFVGQVRSGLSGSVVGLTDRLAYDWPILLAHIVLFACLFSMSIVDLEHYWVDIRFTNLAAAAGFVLHMFWTPRHRPDWVRPFDTTAVVCLCALIGLVVTWIVANCQPECEPDEDEDDEEATADQFDLATKRPRAPLRPPPRLAGWATLFILLALMVGLFFDESGRVDLRHAPRALFPCALLFLFIVSESTIKRESDDSIVQAIEGERFVARKMVLVEFAWLLPAVVFGLIGYFVVSMSPAFSEHVNQGMADGITVRGVSMMRNWSPFLGLSTAASGFVIAGALGWAVRIVFTLMFGKEAFGAGDIHLMAAAGCIAGWPVVVLGFFLTCGLALFGWVVTLPWKQARALPLGPWLSLSFLIVVVFYDQIVSGPFVSRVIHALNLLIFGNSQG